MKKIILTVVLVLVGFVALFCIVVALQPDRFAVRRTYTIAAPPEAVFPQINDLAAWNAWNPGTDLDPNPQTTMSDPSAGKGAKFTWSGNDEIGEGSLVIIDSQPSERVELEQAFVRPMEGKATLVFTLKPEGEGTEITWTMEGKNSFLGKAMCMLMDLDTMLGPKMEEGLASIKAVVEEQREPAEAATEPPRDAIERE